MKFLVDAITRFRRRQDGSMAIEFVIMVPLFVAMISGVVDLSRIYVDQANYYSVARDTARIVARHGMSDTSAETYATRRLAELTDAEAEIDVTSSKDNVTVSISAPVSVLAKFGFLDFLQGTSLSATVVHSLEPV
ncbi:TadE/TadG family type IV pilus assembly protein [Tropicimonas sp. IMCC6043]|uniref:TadE/TadG family type IV pilus assembly protein n=1 Tax=Tropicimonas sp. IMCC6043 TaxID=2510645 RepID=UPI00101BBDD0|nr:TadE family protein [Tropicimonas sp. IMCC6043]RYH08113.1 pilus assembly protein [Tropicimonas sp. IMCC6043]